MTFTLLLLLTQFYTHYIESSVEYLSYMTDNKIRQLKEITLVYSRRNKLTRNNFTCRCLITLSHPLSNTFAE